MCTKACRPALLLRQSRTPWQRPVPLAPPPRIRRGWPRMWRAIRLSLTKHGERRRVPRLDGAVKDRQVWQRIVRVTGSIAHRSRTGRSAGCVLRTRFVGRLQRRFALAWAIRHPNHWRDVRSGTSTAGNTVVAPHNGWYRRRQQQRRRRVAPRSRQPREPPAAVKVAWRRGAKTLPSCGRNSAVVTRPVEPAGRPPSPGDERGRTAGSNAGTAVKVWWHREAPARPRLPGDLPRQACEPRQHLVRLRGGPPHATHPVRSVACPRG